jgi:hypothetical protein
MPFLAKNFAKSRLDPTHSQKLDHFSPHFAPRKVQFFAIFRFAKKKPFFAKKIAKSRLDPSAHVVAVGKPGMGSGDFNPLF